MISKRTSQFTELFEALPLDIQKQTRKQFQLWKENPYHPSLHFKPKGKHWSVRINANYRALCSRKEDICLWVWIGNHTEYERFKKEI